MDQKSTLSRTPLEISVGVRYISAKYDMVKKNEIIACRKLRDDRFLDDCEESLSRTTTGTIKNKDSQAAAKQSYIGLPKASWDEHTFLRRQEVKRDQRQAIRTTACSTQDSPQYEHHQGTT